MQKRGAAYDNEISAQLNDYFHENSILAHAHPMRGSGNTKHDEPDVLLRRHGCDVAIELKKSSGEYIYVDEEDAEQLYNCQNELTDVALGAKFSRRELLFVVLPQVASVTPSNVAEAFVTAVPSAFDPRVTDSGTIALSRPETDVWPSATKGRTDAEVITDLLDFR